MHLEHILNAGENRERQFETYDVLRRKWEPMMQRSCLYHADFDAGGTILMRKQGMKDSECVGIGTVVRRCHKNAWDRGLMDIPLPREYTHPGPNTVRGLFMD